MADGQGGAGIAAGPAPGSASAPAQPEAGKLGVFISYSRDDLAFADQLDVALDLAGFDSKIDRHSIHGSEGWQDKLGTLIREADTVVFVLTPSSAISKICAWEVEQAVSLGKRIIPVLCRPLADTPAPPALAALNYIFFYEEPKRPGASYRTGMAELVKALKSDFGWLRLHTRYQQRAIEWDTGPPRRAANRLLSGDDIAAAKKWLEDRPKDAPPPTALHLDFIKASEDEETRKAEEARAAIAERERLAAEREEAARKAEAAARAAAEAQAAREIEQAARELAQKEAVANAETARIAAEDAKSQAERVTRRTRLGLIAASVLTAVAGWFWWDADSKSTELYHKQLEIERQIATANHARTRASDAAKKAERSEAETRRLTDETQVAQSGLLANAARELVLTDDRGGDVGTAILLALEGLPDKSSDDLVQRKRKHAPEAEFQVDRALRNLRERELLVAPSSAINVAVWSSDRTRHLTAADDQPTLVWSSASGQKQFNLVGHNAAVIFAIWSPDDRWIATATRDNSLHVWDAATGGEVRRIAGLSSPASAGAWSPDGRRLLIASSQSVRTISFEHGVEAATSTGHTGNVRSVAWNRTGKLYLTSSDDWTARIWSAATGREVARLLGHEGGVTSATWSHDGQRIVTSSYDKSARIWEAETGREIGRLEGHSGPVWSAEWSPDGTRLLTASSDQTVRVWDAASGREELRLDSHVGEVASAVWHVDGSRFLTASEDGTVRTWDLMTDREVVRLGGNGGEVKSAASNPDGSRILTTSTDNSAWVWDAETGRPLFEVKGHSERVWTAQWSSDGKRLITGSADMSARVWDGETGRELFRFDGHGDAVTIAVWRPDDKLVFTASYDRTAKIWDPSTGEHIVSITGLDTPITSAAWSPDGTRIVTTGFEETVRVWDAVTGGELIRLIGHSSNAWNANWSPDSLNIATASSDRTARIWSSTSGKELARFVGYGSATSAVWARDGARILSVFSDQTAIIWDATSGARLSRLSGHESDINTAVWAKIDAQGFVQVVTASDDKTVRIWRVSPSTDHLVQYAKSRMRRCLTQAQRKQYFLPAAPPSWCVERRLWPYHGDEWKAWLPKQKAWLAAGRPEGQQPPLPKDATEKAAAE